MEVHISVSLDLGWRKLPALFYMFDVPRLYVKQRQAGEGGCVVLQRLQVCTQQTALKKQESRFFFNGSFLVWRSRIKVPSVARHHWWHYSCTPGILGRSFVYITCRVLPACREHGGDMLHMPK